tara:strand:+ start:38 stop:346 length:309 start_codon:yes stop_codon:yes gene_type:complete
MSHNKLIEDLIMFYVKENYNNYLQEHKISKIDDDKIESVVDQIYTERKVHLKGFLKTSLQQIMKEDYIGDLVLTNICTEIFSDDELCKNRIIKEINLFQKNK